MRPISAASGPAYLFCPASRPDRFDKALAAADFVILDLEDAVAEPDKAAARQNLLDHPLDPSRVIVRVNPIGSPHFALDADVAERAGYGRIMVPKVEQAAELSQALEFDVIALCETARGVLNAPTIASAPPVVALMWGAEDLAASIGGLTSRASDGTYLDVARHARSAVLLAAAAARKPAIDAVFLDIDDSDGLRAEAVDAAASGFAGKACVHPRQVDVVREAYRPTPEQVAWAQRVVDAAAAGGVQVVDGRMVDEPLVTQARTVLAQT